MAEEIKENTEESTIDTKPKEELDSTTKDLIEEALKDATDKSKPWYKRGLSYVIAIILVVLFYSAEQFGPEVVNKIAELVQWLLQLM